MAALLSMFLLAATTVAAAAAVGGGTPPSPSPGRPQPMQQLLDHVRAIPGAFVGWTPQVSFVNNPDGSIGFCFQCQPLATDSRGEYCMTTNSSGREWTAARQVRTAPLPPNGTEYSAPAMLQWNGKQGTAASAAAIYQYLPLGTYTAGPATWNGTSFVWETQTTAEMRPIWRGLNGGGIHGMLRLTQGRHAGRVLTGWQWDHHGVLYMYSDDGGHRWTKSTNLAFVPDDFYGGVEPSSVELSNGTVLTFIRTMRTPTEATLWQAHSTDGGGSFAAAPIPTQFISFQSPVLVLRASGGGAAAATTGVPDGGPPPIVLVFNNARPFAGAGCAGGGGCGEAYRAVLHAAISLDDGNTWKGFREVMRDDAMRGSKDVSADHGTAYPEGAATVDGSIVFQSGQGAEHWSAMRFRPEWLLETSQSADWTIPGAATEWNNVSNFEGTYVSGCTAGTPTDSSTHPLGNARIAACATCTGAEFDPQMHRWVFFQPDVNSSTIKVFAHNTLPKCEQISCASPAGERVQFNPCTMAHAHEDLPPTFDRLQLSNWGNRSGYTQWAADPANWFNCSQLNVSNAHVRAPCSEHDGVAVRPPRLAAADPPHSAHSKAPPPLALCAAMDSAASSAGFSWNFPASGSGTLRLHVLLEQEGFLGAQIALSDHWEPPWHDRHDPTVSIFVLDIAPSSSSGEFEPPGNEFDLTLSWDIGATTALWTVSAPTTGVQAAGGSMNVTRASNMTVGAGGVNYVTVKAFGPGGICVATAHKEDAAVRMQTN